MQRKAERKVVNLMPKCEPIDTPGEEYVTQAMGLVGLLNYLKKVELNRSNRILKNLETDQSFLKTWGSLSQVFILTTFLKLLIKNY